MDAMLGEADMHGHKGQHAAIWLQAILPLLQVNTLHPAAASRATNLPGADSSPTASSCHLLYLRHGSGGV
jgi:hypothetical protein